MCQYISDGFSSLTLSKLAEYVGRSNRYVRLVPQSPIRMPLQLCTAISNQPHLILVRPALAAQYSPSTVSSRALTRTNVSML